MMLARPTNAEANADANASRRANSGKAPRPAYVLSAQKQQQQQQEQRMGGGFVGAAVRAGAALTLSASIIFSSPSMAQAGLSKKSNNDAYAEMMKAIEAQRCGHASSSTHLILSFIFLLALYFIENQKRSVARRAILPPLFFVSSLSENHPRKKHR